MKKIVHQIWIGGELPEQEKGWVAGVKALAEGADWEHRLWSWAELEMAYGGEPLARVWRRLMADFPMPTTYTLMADYYRLRVLGDGGGVYMDTDFCATEWPEWPATGADVYVLGEFFKPDRPSNGFYYCLKADVMRRTAMMAERHLLAQLPPDAEDLARRYVELIRRDGGRGGLPLKGVGGRWLCRHVLPVWRKHAVRMDFIPEEMVGHRQWKKPAALLHYGASHWHEGGRKEGDPFWQGVVEYGEKLVAKAREEARQQKLAALPLYLRPRGGVKVPPPALVYADDVAPPTEVPPQFRLPQGVKRVVVLSNVTAGFSPDMLPLRAGDLVVHCNHSRHREAAMRVKGTRHWLFVRHGKGKDPRGWHWYHEGTLDGFERVFFVNDAIMMQPFRWYRDFRAICKKSPTTGFIAANIMREVAGALPLVLGGFDPGVKHGTPQWEGHDWEVEAQWYAQRGFTLYRPQKQAKILVLIASCCGYVDYKLRAKDGKGTYEQRRACRLTWLKYAPTNVEVMMVVGRGELGSEPLVQQLDVDDGYWDLPAKMKAAFKLALEKFDFEWLVKCDDDTFMHLDRLVQYVNTLPSRSRDIYGAPIIGRDDCVCGGGGYVLHRDMVAAVLNDGTFPDCGREDVEVCKAVLRAGGKVVLEPRFNARAMPAPTWENHLISCHHLTPSNMVLIHRKILQQ